MEDIERSGPAEESLLRTYLELGPKWALHDLVSRAHEAAPEGGQLERVLATIKGQTFIAAASGLRKTLLAKIGIDFGSESK